MKRLAIQTIAAYQKTLSPDHGYLKVFYPHGYCRHYPSCSEYTKLAIAKHGSVRGIGFGLIRIVKCNPLAKPSVDMRHIENKGV